MSEPTNLARVCDACNSKLTPEGLPLSPERAIRRMALIAEEEPIAALIIMRRSLYPSASVMDSARHASESIMRMPTPMRVRRACLSVVRKYPEVAPYLTPEDAKKEQHNAEQNSVR